MARGRPLRAVPGGHTRPPSGVIARPTCLLTHPWALLHAPLLAGLSVSSVGLGAWSWGDRSRYWQNELDKPTNLTVLRWAGLAWCYAHVLHA